MAFNLFFECTLGSAIFKHNSAAKQKADRLFHAYRNYLVQIIFLSF